MLGGCRVEEGVHRPFPAPRASCCSLPVSCLSPPEYSASAARALAYIVSLSSQRIPSILVPLPFTISSTVFLPVHRRLPHAALPGRCLAPACLSLLPRLPLPASPRPQCLSLPPRSVVSPFSFSNGMQKYIHEMCHKMHQCSHVPARACTGKGMTARTPANIDRNDDGCCGLRPRMPQPLCGSRTSCVTLRHAPHRPHRTHPAEASCGAAQYGAPSSQAMSESRWERGMGRTSCTVYQPSPAFLYSRMSRVRRQRLL